MCLAQYSAAGKKKLSQLCLIKPKHGNRLCNETCEAQEMLKRTACLEFKPLKFLLYKKKLYELNVNQTLQVERRLTRKTVLQRR